jgi:hypothetical protein
MKRHRPTEPFAPRPADLIATRLRLVGALLRAANASVEVDGITWTGAMLEELADDHARIERELAEKFADLRAIYIRHDELTRIRRIVLERAIEVAADKAPKPHVRMCRLHRPPLAKVHAAIAEARLRAAG